MEYKPEEIAGFIPFPCKPEGEEMARKYEECYIQLLQTLLVCLFCSETSDGSL